MSAPLSSAQSIDVAALNLDYAQDDESRPLPLIITFPFIAATSGGLWYLIYKAACGAASLLR